MKYEPTTKKLQFSERTLATTTQGIEDHSHSIDLENSQSNQENSSDSGMKYIFSSLHSLPFYLPSHQPNSNNTHQQTITNPQMSSNTTTTTTMATNSNDNNVDDNVPHVTFTKIPVDRAKLRERQYWIDGKTPALLIRGSWNEIHISSLLSKTFNGKTKIMQNKSKNKYKSATVTSPRDQR